MHKVVKKIIPHCIAFFIGAIISYGIFIYEKKLLDDSLISIARIYCDSFFIASLFLLLSGIFLVIAQAGAFDTLSFAFKTVKNRIRHPKNYAVHRQAYHEYVHEKNKKRVSLFHFFTAGFFYLVLAIMKLHSFYSFL